MSTGEARRPPLTAVDSAAELRRWYWLRSELVTLARRLGVSTSGGKVELTERVCAVLDGEAPPPVPPPRRTRARQLSGELDGDSVIPAGQRCTQVLREFFLREIGSGFRFDAAMREFIAHGEGRTLGDAVAHWHATRGRAPGPIAPQFELNRFLRAWREQHPGGSHTDALVAWRRHRSLPVDER